MYPSIITIPNTVSSSNKLNNPSHSALENQQSSLIGQIQTVIGTSDSVLGTLIGDLRNPASPGGGHIQTAALGGTGQTNYTKGDILVASGSSTLTKLAAGLDGQAIVANSSTATGLSYGTPGTNKIFNSGINQSVLSGIETSIVSVNVIGSTLGTSNAIYSKVFWEYQRVNDQTASIIARVQYGANTIISASIVGAFTNNTSVRGTLEHTMIESGTSALQRHFLEISFSNLISTSVFSTRSSVFSTAVSSVESSAAQKYGITMVQGDGSGTSCNVVVSGVVVQKIS